MQGAGNGVVCVSERGVYPYFWNVFFFINPILVSVCAVYATYFLC